ncbi:juvenile hormone acid O-methyltransferase-like [Dermacentor albipictus]|uniref:juvenile hormone acid O-methyltransferase-like n=1 Tax=Dermacentor albipictus TaxID=60249 RepID=UPI0031FCFB2E
MAPPNSGSEGQSEMRRPSRNSVRLCATEYAKHNKLDRKFGEFVLDFCQLAFGAEPDASQQFLDVGCATGDFTREFLLPRCLPCRRIVGVDCSREMVEYARVNSAHEKLDFRVLDIAGDVSGFLEEFGHFDRVYSFLCLHWVDDIVAAFKNISRLMSPTGECLLAFCAVLELADAWKALAAMDRWAKYSEMLLKFVPKTQEKEDVREHLKFVSRLLQEAGLFPTIKEVLKSPIFRGRSEDDIHALYMNTLPIAKLITEEEKSELNVTVRELIRRVHAPESQKNRYKVFIIKASKIPC